MNYTIVKEGTQVAISIKGVTDAKFIKELIDFLEGDSDESKLSILEKECLDFCRKGEKLMAVKHYYESNLGKIAGRGLKESKDIVFELCDKFIKK